MKVYSSKNLSTIISHSITTPLIARFFQMCYLLGLLVVMCGHNGNNAVLQGVCLGILIILATYWLFALSLNNKFNKISKSLESKVKMLEMANEEVDLCYELDTQSNLEEHQRYGEAKLTLLVHFVVVYLILISLGRPVLGLFGVDDQI